MKRVTSRQRLFSWDQFDASAPDSEDDSSANYNHHDGVLVQGPTLTASVEPVDAGSDHRVIPLHPSTGNRDTSKDINIDTIPVSSFPNTSTTNPKYPTLVSPSSNSSEEKDEEDYITCLSTASSMTTLATTFTSLPNNSNPTCTTTNTNTTSMPGTNSNNMSRPISRINLSSLSRNISCNSICELGTLNMSSNTPNNGTNNIAGNGPGTINGVTSSFSFSLEENDHDLDDLDPMPMDTDIDQVASSYSSSSSSSTKRFLPITFDPLTLSTNTTKSPSNTSSPVPTPQCATNATTTCSSSPTPIHSKKRDANGTMKKTVSFSNLLVSYPSNNVASPNSSIVQSPSTSVTPTAHPTKTENTTILPFITLNQDVQLQILSYLNIDSIRSISVSCMTMYQLLYATSTIPIPTHTSTTTSNSLNSIHNVNADAHAAVWWNLIRHTWSPFLSNLLTPYSTTTSLEYNSNEELRDAIESEQEQLQQESYNHSQVVFYIHNDSNGKKNDRHALFSSSSTPTTTTTTTTVSKYRFRPNLPRMNMNGRNHRFHSFHDNNKMDASTTTRESHHSQSTTLASNEIATTASTSSATTPPTTTNRLVNSTLQSFPTLPLGGILAQACSNQHLPTMIDSQFHSISSEEVVVVADEEDDVSMHHHEEVNDPPTVDAETTTTTTTPPPPMVQVPTTRTNTATTTTTTNPATMLRQEIFRRLVERPLFVAAIAAHAPMIPDFDLLMHYDLTIPEEDHDEADEGVDDDDVGHVGTPTPQRRIVVQEGNVEEDVPEFTCYPMKVSSSVWESKVEKDGDENKNASPTKNENGEVSNRKASSPSTSSSSFLEVVQVIQFQGMVGLGNRSVFSDFPFPRPLETIHTTTSSSSLLSDHGSISSSTNSLSSSTSASSLSSSSTSSSSSLADIRNSYRPQQLAKSALESIMARTKRSKKLPFVAPYIAKRRSPTTTSSITTTPKLQNLIEIDLTPRMVAYFEVSILPRDESQEPDNTSSNGEATTGALRVPLHGEELPPPPACVAIGISMNKWDGKGKMPGWDLYSYGYHGDDGGLFHRNGDMIRIYGPKYGTGDTVGCGVNYENGGIFYTLNGEFLGYAFLGQSVIMNGQTDLYPTVGIDTSCPLVCNFGNSKPFMFDFAEFVQRNQGSMSS